MTVSEVRWRSVAAFFAPLLAIEVLAYAAAYWQLGMWKAGKLGGEMTAAILVVLALSAAGPGSSSGSIDGCRSAWAGSGSSAS